MIGPVARRVTDHAPLSPLTQFLPCSVPRACVVAAAAIVANQMTTACHAASPLPPQSDEEIAAAALSAAAAAAASSAGSVSPIPAAARGASPSPSPNGSSPPQSASPSLPPLLSPPPAATLPSPYTSPPDYLIAQSLTYSRKVNPVGDKAGWVCFKVHLVCPGREVGVIAARRRYLPPYFDTFQDCVFVVFGTRGQCHTLRVQGQGSAGTGAHGHGQRARPAGEPAPAP